jgi:hypothetical protein
MVELNGLLRSKSVPKVSRLTEVLAKTIVYQWISLAASFIYSIAI